MPGCLWLQVSDDTATNAMRLLAANGIVVGETGIAGWAGFLTAATDPALRSSLGLDSSSHVVVVATEGATDPTVYAEVVGRRPEAVTG